MYLIHWNKINEEESTYVSIDFRLVVSSKFKPNNAGSVLWKKYNIWKKDVKNERKNTIRILLMGI